MIIDQANVNNEPESEGRSTFVRKPRENAPIIAIVTSLLTAFIAIWIAIVANNKASLNNLYTSFDIANQATIERPELLYTVHGLPKSIPIGEARNIAYLSILLDGFQDYYGSNWKFFGRFRRMEWALRRNTTFLNRILSIPENQKRWYELKKIYYGDFDADFIQAIESLIELENARKEQSQ